MTEYGPDAAEKRVTVARFTSPVEAQIAKGLLESSGIECFVVGENANNLLQAAFRARLQVAEADEPLAKELLGDSGQQDADTLTLPS